MGSDTLQWAVTAPGVLPSAREGQAAEKGVRLWGASFQLISKSLPEQEQDIGTVPSSQPGGAKDRMGKGGWSPAGYQETPGLLSCLPQECSLSITSHPHLMTEESEKDLLYEIS